MKDTYYIVVAVAMEVVVVVAFLYFIEFRRAASIGEIHDVWGSLGGYWWGLCEIGVHQGGTCGRCPQDHAAK